VEAVEEKGSLLHHSEHAVLDPTRLRKLRQFRSVRSIRHFHRSDRGDVQCKAAIHFIQWLSGLLDFEHMILCASFPLKSILIICRTGQILTRSLKEKNPPAKSPTHPKDRIAEAFWFQASLAKPLIQPDSITNQAITRQS
jgi:hypothetical protein